MPYVSINGDFSIKAQAAYIRELKLALNDVGKAAQKEAKERAYQNVSRRSGIAPRSGALGRSITYTVDTSGTGTSVITLTATAPYARYVEEGTGLFGPKKQVIRPKTAKALAWKSFGGGQGPANYPIASALRGGRIRKRNPRMDIYMNFAMFVRGFPGRHYIQGTIESDKLRRYMIDRLGPQMLARVAQAWSE